MVNNNLNNNSKDTIIENVEYLDMDDIKNSWYFDAERFDTNFPLVRSYRSQLVCASEKLFQEWYEYWDAVFSHYSAMEGAFGICFSMDNPSPFSTERSQKVLSDSMELKLDLESNYFLNSRVTKAFNDNKLFLHSKQSLPNGKKFSYSLGIARDSSKLASLKEKFYLNDFHSGSMRRLPLYPHTQLIISRDWDLLKRYFFFMIRNHQYKGSKFIYTVGKNKSENADILAFTDVHEGVAFSELPVDFRFGQSEYTNDSEDSMVEAYKVVVTDRKLTQKDLE